MQALPFSPRGFRSCVKNVGIRDKTLDFTVITQDRLPELKAYLQQPEVAIRVSLGLGEHSATVWGCDLTYEYVKINGEYTT